MDEEMGDIEALSIDPYYKYDNHKVHYDSHTRTILSHEFKEWPEDNQTVLINHTDMHFFELEAQRKKAMVEAAQMQQLGGGGAPPKPQDQPEPIQGKPAGI